MKYIFLLNIFSFFLLSFIKNDCTLEKSFDVKTESNRETIENWNCYYFNNYIIKANIRFPKIEEYDLIKFKITNKDIDISQYSFYLDNDDIQPAFLINKTYIELKLSDIISGGHILKIFVKDGKPNYYINLDYSFSNYSNTKRLRDNDNYILNPGDHKILIYEYGRNKNKIVFFKVLGNSVKDFNFKYEINDGNGNKTISKKSFFNGYSLIIRNEILSNNARTIKFYFDDNDEILHVSTSLKDDMDKCINTTNNHFDIIIFEHTENYIINLDIKDSEKYIFKFTTYTKNIRANFICNNIIRPLEINEESSYFILDSINNYTKVIFYNMGKEEYATLSFDVLYLGNNNYNIIRGFPQRNILHYNMTALYKPDNYSSKSKMAVINSHIIRGHPNFYLYKNKNENERIISDINGFISLKNAIDKEEFIYVKVECPSEECIFDIDMKGIDEFTHLKKDYKIFCFLEKSDIDKYQINVNNINNNDYLLINIHYPIQPPNVTIDYLKKNLDEYKISLIENIISYNIPIREIDRDKSDNIFINITTNNSVYYGINYEIKEENNKNIYLENCIAYIIDLKNDINPKNYIIRQNTDSKLIINVNTFGNDLVLKIDNSEYKPINNLIHLELDKIPEEKEKYYYFNITNNSKISDQYINLYIYEPSSNSKIFIQEGIIYNNKLTNNNNELNYYLHLNKSKEYILYFSKYSNSNIIIKINNEPSKIISKTLELIDIIKMIA